MNIPFSCSFRAYSTNQIGARSDGIEKQRNQCRALLKWAMRHLSGSPKDQPSKKCSISANGCAVSVRVIADKERSGALSGITFMTGRPIEILLVEDSPSDTE
jgi:hypothetical protein